MQKEKNNGKKELANSKKLINQKDYQNLLQDLKGIIANKQYQAYKAVDNIKVQAYWQIGERIVREEMKNKERAEYGKYLINNLSIDLDIESKLIYKMVKFYRVYPIVATLWRQLSWKHYAILITIFDNKERIFYENKIIANSWSVRELARQIKNRLYQKTDDKEIEELNKTKLPAVSDIKNIFKPDYDFNFLEIAPRHFEKELEAKIIKDIEHFLKELGEDFMFLGHQVPILIDNEKHYIDLVLYHRGIPCVVLVDLKAEKLDSRDIGQMNKYIGYYRNNKQYFFEEDTIGLIICREAGREEAVYALDGLEEKIFVSIYKTKLPSEEKIKKVMKML
ncbi:MAG: PDDEXK nuclease domain-containing protein [Patescibacteria group bacterium]